MPKRVTLSFDNGPDPEVTPRVLDLLSERGILTTFFVLGDKLRDPGRRALCERAQAEGHWIGNHTFNHITPLGRARHSGAPELEIGRTQALISDLAHPEKLFRPFGGGGILNDGLFSPGALDLLQREGFTCVTWNVVPRDWEDPENWVEVAMDQCAGEDWPLVVLHDLQTTAMDRLDDFLDLLAQEDYAVVQEFPADCVPVRRGEIVGSLEGLVSSGPG
jgi:peptidoglycan-N-acetylglucosamine deacetylase